MGIFVTLPKELVTFSQALRVTFKMLLTEVPQGILQDTQAANFSLLMGGGRREGGRTEHAKSTVLHLYCITCKRFVNLNQDIL